MTPEIVGTDGRRERHHDRDIAHHLAAVCGGTSVITVVISSGIITAVPEAWMTRAKTSSSRLGAKIADAGAEREQRHRER